MESDEELPLLELATVDVAVRRQQKMGPNRTTRTVTQALDYNQASAMPL
jgi:hypothetical protein